MVHGATNTVQGVGAGVDAALSITYKLSPSVVQNGLNITRIQPSSPETAKGPVMSAYLTASKAASGRMTVFAYDKKNNELGRVTRNIKLDANGAGYHDQDSPNQREFVVTELDFETQNNLPTDLTQGLQTLRTPTTNVVPIKSQATQDIPPYQNQFKAVRRGIPIVPEYSAEYAKPSAHGRQSATVVGPPGEEIHTDEMGRIKLQFHWQRPQDHPQGTAALDDKSSTWVRVMYSWAGVNWGCQQIPRVGQEVQVDFIENDIDRPIVMGVTHNGRHMPPTFSGAGTLPANKTLSGIKTKEYKGSLYNELLMDDSTNETRIKLSSEHAKTQLNQGYLIHPRTEGKGEPRGEGFELRTDEAGAIRAAKGLLISTEYGVTSCYMIFIRFWTPYARLLPHSVTALAYCAFSAGIQRFLFPMPFSVDWTTMDQSGL